MKKRQKHPLFYLAVYAPAIAALVVIFYRQGVDGIRCCLSRLLLDPGVAEATILMESAEIQKMRAGEDKTRIQLE